jgi:hypothetical protein
MGRREHHFDPIKTREHLLASYGVAMNLTAEFDPIQKDRSLTGYGEAMINQGIECLLVGLDDLGYQVLERGVRWLSIANEEREIPHIYFPDTTEAARYFAVGLGNWLLHGLHDWNAFDKFARHYDQYFSRQNVLDCAELGLVLPEYVAARACERAIDLFERTSALKMPRSLNNIRSAPCMSYVVAIHRLGRQYTENDLRQALQSFLSQEIPSDLGSNHRKAAATWMKIAHWTGEQTRQSAREALLHCYDYLKV